MKFLAMHITNQKWSFDIFTVGNVQNIFMEYDHYLVSWWFWHKGKIDNFYPYNVFLAIATNIPVLLMTGFVVQGHTLYSLWVTHSICNHFYLSFHSVSTRWRSFNDGNEQDWSFLLLGAIFKQRYRHRKTVHCGEGRKSAVHWCLANIKTVSHYERTQTTNSKQTLRVDCL